MSDAKVKIIYSESHIEKHKYIDQQIVENCQMNKETLLEEINQLSIEDLMDIEPQISRMITSKQKQVKKDLSVQFKEMAAQHGLTIDEILGGSAAKPATRKLEPKYRHPEDPSLTWVGRGKRPTWLQQLLDGGADLQDFAIDK